MRFCLVYLLLWLSRSLAAKTAETTRSLNGPDASETIPGQYIVVFDEEKMKASGQSVGTLATSLATEVGVTVKHTYDILISGFSIKDGDEKAVKRLLENSMIKDVVPDSPVYSEGPVGKKSKEEDGVFLNGGNQTEDLPWGLDRIDDTFGTDGSFEFPDNPGDGVDMYFIDTGIAAFHQEFAGRLAPEDEHFNFIDDSQIPSWNDCVGFGTGFAGIAAGTTYGVAKSATLHSVRITDCEGSTTSSLVIAGLGFVARQCQTSGQNCIVMIAAVGAFNVPINDAVNAAVDMGVTVVVSAGFSDTDACLRSPSSAEKAITVAATTRNDERMSDTNFGPCVDIFAPGEGILTAGNGCADCVQLISGSSLAAPHVAGVAALILQDYAANGYTTDPAAVKHQLLSDAVEGIVSDAGPDSPNLFLQMNTPFVSPPPSAAPTVTLQPTDIFSEEPTMAPTESHSPTGTPTVLVCEDGQDKIEVIIQTDHFGAQSGFVIIESCTDEVVYLVEYDVLESLQTYSFPLCVGFGQYSFIMFDAARDGMFFPAFYRVLFNGEQVAFGGYFGESEQTVFGDDDCITPAPTSSNLPSMAPSDSHSPTWSTMPSMQPTTPAPTTTPSVEPTDMPALSPTVLECEDNDDDELLIQIDTDDWPEETSFELINECNGNTVLEVDDGLEKVTTHIFRVCVKKDSQYTFTVFDSFGDGTFGLVRLYLNDDLIFDAPDFDYEYSFTFQECESDEPPSMAPAVPRICKGEEVELELEVHTDSDSHETSFRVENACNGDTVMSVEASELTDLDVFMYSMCLTKGLYRLVVSDSWGDGILDPGYVLAMYDGNMIVNKPQFGDNYVMTFGGVCPPPPPPEDECPCDQNLLPLRLACKLRKPVQCLLPAVPFL